MKYKGNYQWRSCINLDARSESHRKCCSHYQLKSSKNSPFHLYIMHLLQNDYIVIAYYNVNDEIVSLEHIQDPTMDSTLGIKEEECYGAYADYTEFDVICWVKRQINSKKKLDSAYKPKAHLARITFHNIKLGRCLSILDKNGNELSTTRYGGAKNSISNEYIKKLKKDIDFSEMKYIEDTMTFKHRWLGRRPTIYTFKGYNPF